MSGADRIDSARSTSTSSVDAGTWGLFLLLSLIWGSSYLVIKIGLEEGIAPLTLVSIRTLLATALLAVVLLITRGRLPRSGRAWFDVSVVATTNAIVPYTLITWGELHISSGMAVTLTEVLATSDVPGGVINLVTGHKRELVPWLAAHKDVNALDLFGVPADLRTEVEASAIDSMKRVASPPRDPDRYDWLDDGRSQRPEWIARFMEMKTVWHPIGV